MVLAGNSVCIKAVKRFEQTMNLRSSSQIQFRQIRRKLSSSYAAVTKPHAIHSW